MITNISTSPDRRIPRPAYPPTRVCSCLYAPTLQSSPRAHLLNLMWCDNMANLQPNLQPPRKQYDGDVYITKEFTRGETAISHVAYEDIHATGAINVTIHPNHKKSAMYCCAADSDPVALSTDIVVSTVDGAVRLGDMFHFTTKGKAVVSTHIADIKKSDRDTLRVYLDVSQKSCVVYTAGEDADLHYHGTRVVSSNFIPPNSGAEDEQTPNRPGCTELHFENGGLRHIDVKGSLFVDYYLHPARSDLQYQKIWYSVKQDNEEWFRPPADVVVQNKRCDIFLPRRLLHRGDFTVSRDGVSVLIDTSGGVECTGPGWVHVGNRNGPDDYRSGTVIVID